MDYQNGKIYQVTNRNYTKCYIGSTTQPLDQRFKHHMRSFRSWRNGIANRTTAFDMFHEFGIDGCFIELIERYPCNSKEELTKREGFYIKVSNCVNKKIEGRTRSEYYEDNNVKIKREAKLYRDAHKEQCKQLQKKWFENHKDYLKNYYDANFEKFRQRQMCDCGGKYTQINKVHHLKTKKHRAFIERTTQLA